MHAAPLSISTLYSQIEKASNKEMASAITQAFEQLEANQKEALTQNKQETVKEINPQGLATKGDIQELKKELKTDIENLKVDIKNLETKFDAKIDLKLAEQKLEIHKEISFAKWQVLGGMVVLFLAQTLAKHFGLF